MNNNPQSLPQPTELPNGQESVPPESEDPFAPDAPIHHLLSISKNPLVKEMSDKQLMELVQRIRTLASSPQTMTAKLQSESKGRKPKVLTPEQIRRKAILDQL